MLTAPFPPKVCLFFGRNEFSNPQRKSRKNTKNHRCQVPPPSFELLRHHAEINHFLTNIVVGGFPQGLQKQVLGVWTLHSSGSFWGIIRHFPGHIRLKANHQLRCFFPSFGIIHHSLHNSHLQSKPSCAIRKTFLKLHVAQVGAHAGIGLGVRFAQWKWGRIQDLNPWTPVCGAPGAGRPTET